MTFTHSLQLWHVVCGIIYTQKHKNMTNEELKNHLLAAGVKNLKEFGYPHVDTENILTDIVYAAMFKSMLIDNKGKDDKFDDVIDELLNVIK